MVTAPITAEQLLRARQLFDEVMGSEIADRIAVLDRGCNGDETLRAVLERMITADEQEHPLLDKSLVPSQTLQVDLPANATIGRYRILRAIGAGGMGTVYLADVPDQTASELFAVKVVRWASPDLLQRFDKEQSIVRQLEHPNIARFVDAGISGHGSPYFVMEYVEGRPIHRWCDEERLSVGERIELFRQVCAALRYLHQNLIVHRDIKPANILVTAEGRVKLLDFGISKLLRSPAAEVTNTSVGLMTPDYASPEQVSGGPISTLTDVYAVGVLLYELLTGVKPFTSSQGELQETLRRICDGKAARPSEVVTMNRQLTGELEQRQRELRGELDNIVMKAMEREPQRRYASVEQLDEDLRRYEAGLPVLAQGDSITYRLRKFVSRYKGPVAAGSVMLALLAGGIVATSIEARVAHHAATEAEMHAREAERQRAEADAQRQIAQQERNRAESESAEAEREKENAQRRLQEIERLTRSAADLYKSVRSNKVSADAEMVARYAQDSLRALQNEKGLRPEEMQLLDATAAAVRSYQLASDRTWQVPKGWSATETKLNEYRVGLDEKVRQGGKTSLFLRSLHPTPSGSVFVFQTFDATQYRGKRVRLIGYLRSEKISNQAILGLTLLGSDSSTVGYEGVSASGNSGWSKYTIVLDVPSACKSIYMYLQLSGTGTLWADDFAFDIVPTSVKLTHRTEPDNLGFATE